MPEQTIVSPSVPAQGAQIDSMVVLTMPNGDPVIFTSTKLGFIVVLKPNMPPITFGAHNDKP